MVDPGALTRKARGTSPESSSGMPMTPASWCKAGGIYDFQDIRNKLLLNRSNVQFNTILLLFYPLRPIFWSSTVKEGWSTWTPGTERRSASSSAGATWNPFTLINSFRRSVMNQSPSSSYLVKQTIVKTFLHFLTFQHLQCESSPLSRLWQQWLQGFPGSRSSRLDLIKRISPSIVNRITNIVITLRKTMSLVSSYFDLALTDA